MNTIYFTIGNCFKPIANKRIISVATLLFVVLFSQFGVSYCSNISEKLNGNEILMQKDSAAHDSAKIESFILYLYSLGGIDTSSRFKASVFLQYKEILVDTFRLDKEKRKTEVELKLKKKLPLSQLSKMHLNLNRKTGKDSLVAFKIQVMRKMTDGRTDFFVRKTPAYYCISDTSIILPSPTRKKTKMLAAQDSIQIHGALYNNINSVPDNDPSGFSQYYISASIPLRKLSGITDTSRGFCENLILFRNVYITPAFNASKLNYVPLVSYEDDYHANKLDLLQYAYFKVPVNLNLATYIYHSDNIDYGHFYWDFIAEGIFTRDTIELAGSSHIISSFLFGTRIYYQTTKDVSKDMTFHAGASIFKINPITSSIKTDLNVQSRNLPDTALAANKEKPLLNDCKGFFSLEAFVSYDINSTASTYLHFNYTSNFIYHKDYVNNFFRIQLGFSVDVLNLFKNLKGSEEKSRK
jgi:hypothetical protein